MHTGGYLLRALKHRGKTKHGDDCLVSHDDSSTMMIACTNMSGAVPVARIALWTYEIPTLLHETEKDKDSDTPTKFHVMSHINHFWIIRSHYSHSMCIMTLKKTAYVLFAVSWIHRHKKNVHLRCPSPGFHTSTDARDANIGTTIHE